MKKKFTFIFGGILVGGIGTSILASCGGQSGKTNGYNVTYHAGTGYTINGKEEFTASNVSSIELEPTPDYFEGQRFSGWFTSKDCKTGQVNFPYRVSKDINLYAKWEADLRGGFTVNFDANGGTEVPSYVIKEGNAISGQPYTSKENYKFNGWKEKATDINTITFPYTPKRDITLVADYTQVNFKTRLHTIGSKPQGTTVSKDNNNIYETEATNKIDVAPSTQLSTASFTGWFDNPECKNEPVQFPYTITEDKCDLYAGFDTTAVSGVTVTLHDGEETKQLLNLTRLPYAPEPISKKSKKKFKGWSLAEGGQVIKDYSTLTFDADFPLYAIWDERNTKKIQFIDDDGTTKIKEVEYFIGEIIGDTPMFESKLYFDFNGWYKDKNKINKVTFPLTVDNSTPTTLYSDSKRNSFDLLIKDSETGNVLHTMNKVNDVSYIPIITVPGREKDYEYNYYSLKQDGTGDRIGRDRKFNINSPEIKDNAIVLYEQWNKANRKYQFAINYGNNQIENFKTNKTSVNVSELKVIQDEHKKVIGWKDTSTGEEFLISSGVNIPVKERKLDAIWEDLERSIIVNRASNDNPQSYPTKETVSGLVKEGLTLAKIPVDTSSKTHYKLAGFYFENPSSEIAPEVHQLSESIPENIAEIWEAWEVATANATINYIDEDSNIIRTENREKLYTQFDFKNIEATITDYKRDEKKKIRVNDEEIEGTDITLSKDNNVINVYIKKIAFKVTYFTQFNDLSDTHVETSVTSVSNYIPTIQSEYCEFQNKWYDTQQGKIVTAGDTITKDTELIGQVIDTRQSEAYNITFSVGSTQLLARFDDNTTVKSKCYQGYVEDDSFPAATCPGNLFDGWYDAENGGTKFTYLSPSHLPDGGKLYAHWKPVEGFFSLVLKLGEDGIFTETKNKIGLISTNSTTKWKEIKNNIPDTSFQDNEYTVNYWSLTKDGEEIDPDHTFSPSGSTPTMLYAIQKEKVMTPSDFNHDNWATIINVVKNNVKKDDGETSYENGLEAFNNIYRNTYDEATSVRRLGNDSRFLARVIGKGQDYADSTKKVLPLTFEITEVYDTSSFDNNGKGSWTQCGLKTKLDENGEFFNSMPKILRTNFSSAFKAVSNNNYISHKLFIPSGYEIKATSDKLDKDEFIYDWYNIKDKTKLSERIMKDYIISDNPCSYWVRNGNEKYLKIEQNRETLVNYWTYATAALNTGRGVNIMFCLGTGYKR